MLRYGLSDQCTVGNFYLYDLVTLVKRKAPSGAFFIPLRLKTKKRPKGRFYQ